MPESVERCDCGRPSDLYRSERSRLLVLLWHGRGPHEGVVMRPLAQALVTAGAAVLVPDWDSTGADGGAERLLESLGCAQRHRGQLPLVLAGWSRGGTAALSVAWGVTDPALRPAAVVGLAANVEGDSPLGARLQAAAPPLLPVVLVHCAADDIVDPAPTRDLAKSAAELGWPVRHQEVDTDHAGIIGTEYDEAQGVCVPSDRRQALVGLAASTAAVLDACAPESHRRSGPHPQARSRDSW